MAFDPNKLAAVKQKTSGFDPAKLQAAKQAPVTQQPAQEQGLFGKTMDVLGTPGRGIAALAYGAGQIGQQPLAPTIQKMAEITKPGFQPQSTAESAANVAGNLTNFAVPVGAALQGAGKLAKAAKLGPVIKGALSSTSKSGNAIKKVEEAAGLLTGKPTTSVKASVNELVDAGDLVKSGLKQNTPEFAQTLKDYADRAGQYLDRGPKVIGKKNYALLSQAKAEFNNALNQLIPGRSDAQLAARAGYIRDKALKSGIILGGAEFARRQVMDALRGQ